MPEGQIAEGRIKYIEDQVGNRVTCEYDSQTGNLVAVKDANNRVTEIETTGTGITERVTKVTIPDGRFALFGWPAPILWTSHRVTVPSAPQGPPAGITASGAGGLWPSAECGRTLL